MPTCFLDALGVLNPGIFFRQAMHLHQSTSTHFCTHKAVNTPPPPPPQFVTAGLHVNVQPSLRILYSMSAFWSQLAFSFGHKICVWLFFLNSVWFFKNILSCLCVFFSSTVLTLTLLSALVVVLLFFSWEFLGYFWSYGWAVLSLVVLHPQSKHSQLTRLTELQYLLRTEQRKDKRECMALR